MPKTEIELNKEIDELAQKMTKSTVTDEEAKKALFDTLMELGPDGLKKAVPNLTDAQKELLKACLEDLAKTAKKPEEQMTKAEPKVEDEKTPKQTMTDSNKMRTEALSGSDDEDEKKLMDAKNANHSNQGGPKDKPEGWEGQVIKSEDKEKEGKEKMSEKKPMDKLMQIEEAEHNKDIDGDGKIAEKMEKQKKMKKALEEIVALAKAKKMTKEQVIKAIKDSGEDLEKAKQKLLKEEDQSEFKPQDESQKEKIPEDKGDLEIKAQQKADDVKVVKKSVVWNPKNTIGANTLGRNTHYDVDEFIIKSEEQKQDIIKKGAYFNDTQGETLKKSEGQKADINDLIEKGMDYSTDEIKRIEGVRDHKVEGKLVKSFHDRDIAIALGMSEEEYKKLMGE